MTEKDLENLKQWFKKYEDDKYEHNLKLDFDSLENKPHNCRQVAAILFLASKLKEEYKKYDNFLHCEHHELYIGDSFNIFEVFTEDEIKVAVCLGIQIADFGEGFMIYAST